MMRNAYLDYLKVGLAVMVVALHAGIFQEQSAYLSYLFVNGCLRLAVPVFFVINGFFFFNVMNRNKSVFAWINRMLILYVVWMLIYSPFYYPKYCPPGAG